MRRLMIAVCVCTTTFASAVANDGGEARFWTDNTGSFTIEATLSNLDREKGQVTLHLRDASEVVVPLRRLSREDLAWLEKSFAPETAEVRGVTWFTRFKDASNAAVGSDTTADDKPIMCFRALGELTGFM